MAIIQLTPTGASGEGTNQLSPTNFGVNTSRSSQRSTTFTAGEYGLNKLTITQEHSPALFISFNDSNIKQIVSPSSATSWTVSGSTNGRYMKYSISNGVTVSSAKEYSNNTSQGSSIGTTYSSVSSFVGGSQEFEYRVTISIPSGLSAGNYTLTVYSSDTQNGSGAVNQTFTLRVTAQAVNVQSVSIKSLGETVTTLDIGKGASYKYNNQTITVNSNSRNKLTYEVSPQDASVVSATWSSYPTSVATVSSSGLVTGKSEGTATITCTVTDANGNTASATCTVNVYEQGTITIADNLTILYNELSRSVAVSHSGIMTNSTWAINRETRPWISSVTINEAHTSITATRVTTDQTSLPASTNMYLTATDRLRNTITSNTVILAQEMRAAIDGVDAIAVVSNKATYTASYLPFNITGSDNQVEWYIGNAQQAPYASVSDTAAISCSLNVLEGANNQIVLLALRNVADNSITASKEVMTTYVTEALDHPFTFESGTDNVTVAAQDVNDYTPHIILRSVPAVSISDLRVSSRTGELASAAINSKNHKIFTTFTANTSASSRSLGTLQVTYGTGSEAFSLPVYYSQEGIPATDTNTILDAQDPTARYRNGDITVGSTVVFTNNRDISYTFKGLRCMVTGYDSDDGPESTTSEILFTHALSIANNEVQVPANDSVEKLYSDTWSWSGDWSEVKSIYLHWNASNKQSDTVKIILSGPTPEPRD